MRKPQRAAEEPLCRELCLVTVIAIIIKWNECRIGNLPPSCPAEDDILEPGLSVYPALRPFLLTALSLNPARMKMASTATAEQENKLCRSKKASCRKIYPKNIADEIEMIVMDYCGVEFSVVEAAGGSSWNWHLSILNEDEMKTSGKAASRAAAINHAHEAIGKGLRANASPDQGAQLPRLVGGVLHGAVAFRQSRRSRRCAHL
jgi:hypothetical protein